MFTFSSRVLRAMLMLDETRSFSLAAERSFVTQSALSQMVQKLEAEIGVQLVDRDRRQVSFTAEGMRLLASARRIMQELEDIDLDLREHASGARGHIHIAALPSLAAHWLPPIIARYREQAPNIEFGLFDVPPQRALELVRARQADFALTADGPGRAGFEATMLFRENFVLVCHREHKLAGRRRIKMTDLNGQRYIRLVRTGSIAMHLEAALRPLRLIDTGLEVDQVATVAGLVGSKLGVSVVPEMSIPYFDSGAVVTVPIDGADLHRPIYIVRPSARTLSKAARQFVSLLEHEVAPEQRKARAAARPKLARPKLARPKSARPAR